MNKLVSTRNKSLKIGYSEAILKGLSDDNGLFIPENFNKIDFSNKKFLNMEYKEYVFEILSTFIKEIDNVDLKKIIDNSYDNKFDVKEIVPVKKVGDVFVTELFHGPTLAFKDMALSILPNLLKASKEIVKTDKNTVILTATSGDTGKAALEGFSNIDGIDIIVFYPKDGVSPIQKRQMVTQLGDNTHVYGIDGNFDDAQSNVKSILNDMEFKNKLKDNNYSFSSANSINIGRLIPQIVYYVSSYFDLIKKEEIKYGDKVDFIVPTGNFGNILAGKYAKSLGLPIGKLVCASNKNNILTEFINQGSYDLDREFIKTMSPSMDILISSNLERLLFHLADGDTNKVSKLMNELKDKKFYKIDSDMKENLADFEGFFCNEENTMKTIKNIFDSHNYLVDPHTAVALNVYNQYKEKTSNKCVVLSTASPYKFPVSVAKSLEIYDEVDDFKLLELISSFTKTKIPNNILELKEKKAIHNKNISKADMKLSILDSLSIK